MTFKDIFISASLCALLIGVYTFMGLDTVNREDENRTKAVNKYIS